MKRLAGGDGHAKPLDGDDMTNVLYRTQMDDIVIEVTPTYVLSDLWDFSERIAIEDIVNFRVRRTLHHVSTLVLPLLALFFGILGSFAVVPRLP